MADDTAAQDRRRELAGVAWAAATSLEAAHRAREAGLRSCRTTIRESSRAIRAVHRLDRETFGARLHDAEEALRAAQGSLAQFPEVAHAGFLRDAEKEYAEAVLTAALVGGELLPDAAALRIGLPAWLNGLAEAASELRRHLLDRLRDGDPAAAEALLCEMDAVYELLVGVDYPDAITGGLRRTTDALRAVLERSRSDLTLTLVQERLVRALEGPRASRDPASR
ncbi:MAG: haloacid dehalogenase [Acidimicrobiales bacterium]